MLINLIGFIAFGLGLIGFLNKNQTKLKVIFSLSSLLWSFHFFLLGGITASLIQFAMSARTFLSIYLPVKSKKITYIYTALSSCIFISLMAFSWKDSLSLLPGLAAINSTVAYTQSNLRMRYLFIFSSFLWLINAIYLKSYPSILCECFMLISNGIGILRIHRKI